MLATLLLLTALTAAPAAPAPPAPAPLAATPADLAFLRGDWEGSTSALQLEERWTEEAGGLMLGVGRTLKGGKAVFFEFLRIEFRPDGVYYVAQPRGREATEFRLTAKGEGSATFENPRHDHPKRIHYRRTAGGGLDVDLDGDEGEQTFRFRPARR